MALRRQSRRLGANPPGIIGLREVIVSGSSLPMPTNSSDSSWGVDVVACARVSALPVVSACSSSFAAAPASSADVAHARSTPMHAAVNSWADRVSSQGPRGRRSSKVGVSGPAEDLLLVSEVEAAVIFVGRRCTGAGCRFISRLATRHWYQARWWWCGDTFYPPGGSWFPFCVTSTR